MFPFPNIEKLTLVAPLGLCFHDAATGERVTDGLSVSVYPARQSVWKKRTEAFPNRSGVYVLHKADGLEEFTRGDGSAEFWASYKNRKKTFIAEVTDNERRFQPFRLEVELPVEGIYRWKNIPPVSPAKDLSSIPLYSAPTRKPLGAAAVIRAELHESKDKPASFAVLEAFFSGSLVARGIADRQGRLVLMFPALSPQNNPFTSPPSDATRVTLADQQWALDLAIKYEPAKVFEISSPPSSPPVSGEETEEFLPDLKRVLEQRNGTLWADAAKTESFTTAVLKVGRELVLRSREASNLSPAVETASSYLFVSPA
jgi:hypothetical protein